MRIRTSLVFATIITFAVLGASLCSAQTPAGTPAAPPVAPVRPVTDDYFGTKVVDNYRYFENLKDPEVQQWMTAQADYTRATLDALPGYGALLKRIDEMSASLPAWVNGVQIVGGRYYSLRLPANASFLYLRSRQSDSLHLRLADQRAPPTNPDRVKSQCATHKF